MERVEMEYMVVNCLGDENVVNALSDKTAEVPHWDLHSVVPAGLVTMQHPISGRKEAIMAFLVIFERPHDPNRIEA